MLHLHRPSKALVIALGVALSLAATAVAQNRAPEAPAPSRPAVAPKKASEDIKLKSASDFDNIKDEKERSIAIFEETGKVLLNPRCVNCHPAGDRPLQGLDMHPHQPPVERGQANFGVPGMMCNTCHGPNNVKVIAQSDDIKSIPGNPNWHLAPIEMAWQGRTLGEICRQIKDKDRNGGKTLADLVDHMAHDDLVGWAWHPGAGRKPVPGTQKQFGELYKAWAATGAHCPDS
ncbi:Isoquinoline 1-oxidoreductase subunit [Jiella sp. MQZ9-1]|uniref:Isoquinoline 1-oxidoreductase subunit n=1 Tax=Jiella flava TaxID=2816857 RepID=A0A939FXU0_9HYPH|nr:Isoquinoline 1-oxidoreductase subunit [Jiella flava]MBO0662186.1 Isoquinoline 1-oxidoreductase subunit [Jiella flava]MCD2470984.1 Isoquinoline 1-oxidoreductase subunit [Jiella flava]